jgi:hypothetical protein
MKFQDVSCSIGADYLDMRITVPTIESRSIFRWFVRWR